MNQLIYLFCFVFWGKGSGAINRRPLGGSTKLGIKNLGFEPTGHQLCLLGCWPSKLRASFSPWWMAQLAKEPCFSHILMSLCLFLSPLSLKLRNMPSSKYKVFFKINKLLAFVSSSSPCQNLIYLLLLLLLGFFVTMTDWEGLTFWGTQDGNPRVDHKESSCLRKGRASWRHSILQHSGSVQV